MTTDATPTVTVVGSVHMDLVATADRLPRRGETLLGRRFAMHPGGKAGNQATQVARHGVPVFMLGRVGNDVFGEALRAALARAGVDVTHVGVDDEVPSGASPVLTDEGGDHASVIVPGASRRLSRADIDAAGPALARSAVLMAQLEIPLETSGYAATVARSHGARVVLNAAPVPDEVGPLEAAFGGLIEVLVVNAGEAAALSGVPIEGIEPARRAAEEMRKRFGAAVTVVTLGAGGALLLDEDGFAHESGWEVPVVDTVGAGDAFVGTLASELTRGVAPRAALPVANAAGALAVGKQGAYDALPTGAEVRRFLAGRRG